MIDDPFGLTDEKESASDLRIEPAKGYYLLVNSDNRLVAQGSLGLVKAVKDGRVEEFIKAGCPEKGLNDD